MLSAFASGLHILGIAVGGMAFAARSQHLHGPLDPKGVMALLTWDNIAGMAAMVFVGAGLWRLFGGLEKPLDFYTGSWVFWLKMGLFALLITLECAPMFTFIQWRIQQSRGESLNLSRVPLLRKIDRIELLLFPCVVLVAPFMARGYGQMNTTELPAQVAVAGQTAVVADGARTYSAMCAPCHGVDGRGKPGLGADFVESAVLDKTDAALLISIEEGVPGTSMPAWREQLDTQARLDVLAYIRAAFEEK